MRISHPNRVTRTSEPLSVGLRFFSKTQPVCETPSLHFGSGLKLRDGGSLPNTGYQRGEFRTERIQTTATHERIVQLSQQLARQSANQPLLTQSVERFVAQDVAIRHALKIEQPTFNGNCDFREWTRKLQLCYEAKVFTD